MISGSQSAVRRALLALLLVVALHDGAAASPPLELLGAAESRHPFTARVFPTGAAAAYFNPALLPGMPRSAHLHVTVLVQRLDLGYGARPAGADVPGLIYHARAVSNGDSTRLPLRPLPTDRLRNARGGAGTDATEVYLGLGTVTNLLDGRLAFAVYGVVPLTQFQSHQPFFVDEREQYFSNSLHFEMFEDRTSMASFSFALAGRPLPWLRLGAAVTLHTATVVDSEIYYPDASERDDAIVTSASTIRFELAPLFAVAVEPLDELTVTATVHLESRTDLDGASDVQFWSYPYPEGESSLRQPFSFSFGYLPLRVSTGVSWTDAAEDDDIGWAVAANLVWSRWSQYVDRNRERPADAWSDTFTLAAGGDLTFGSQRFGVDLAWIPSPVPAQRGRSSYVDNDRIAASVGWEMGTPLGPVALEVGVHLQLQTLLDRRVTKSADAANPVIDEFPDAIDPLSGERIPASEGLQTNNPGYPGFDSGGWILATGASLRLVY